MRKSNRLAVAAIVLAVVVFLYGLGIYSLSPETLFGSISVIVLAWAFKFILGSLIEKKEGAGRMTLRKLTLSD